MSYAIFMLSLLILLVITGIIMVVEEVKHIDLADVFANWLINVSKRFGLGL